MTIRNLVFQGGGVKGIAYAGAIEVLEQRGQLKDVARVAGTSAGSITAALLAVGAGSADINQILRTTMFSSFTDGGGWIFGAAMRLLSKYGIYKGDTLLRWMRKNIGDITQRLTGKSQPDLTFAQLRALAQSKPGVCRELYTISTNLTQQRPEVFSAESTPDVAIALAVRMSVSIPFYFEAVPFGGNMYVDGGVSWNYPIDLFDGETNRPVVGMPARIRQAAAVGPDTQTLGFCLGSTAQIESERMNWALPPVQIKDLDDMVKGLFSFVINESTRLHLDEAALARSVFVNDANVPTTAFDLTQAQIDTLVKNGRDATIAFLDRSAASVA
ncbi:MAG TPA: patatin-like phospholipase family protein, partial [Longimicrobium sp.]|nr:patatin-like phospholipase family protein [Longimicrobium sp.]